MKLLRIAMGVLAATLVLGCATKTPEEIEAAKYPKVEPNPPEVSREIQESLRLRQEGGG